MALQNGIGVEGGQLLIIRNGVHVAAITESGIQMLAGKSLTGGGVARGTQQAEISDPSGGITVDTQARSAINSIIDALQTYGMVAGNPSA